MDERAEPGMGSVTYPRSHRVGYNRCDLAAAARYKIDTQKSVALLYTNNEKSEREIKETIPYDYIKKNKIPGSKPI